MRDPRRGDVWWVEMPDKRRPVLVLTRNAAIPVRWRIIVAPITRSARGIQTEVALDEDDGMPVPCAATFDNLTTVPASFLTERVTQLSAALMRDVCVGCLLLSIVGSANSQQLSTVSCQPSTFLLSDAGRG